LILDANVVVGAVHSKDRLHSSALALLNQGGHQIHCSNMAEVASILHRRHSRPDAVLDALYALPELQISYAPVERLAGKLHARRGASKVSLADCLGAALALTTGEAFATGDRDLLPYCQSDGLKLEIL